MIRKSPVRRARVLYPVYFVNAELVNNDRLPGKFWTKRSISNQRVGFKGSMFKGSEVDPSFNYPYGINGIGKKREAINPERGTLNLLTQTDRMSNFCSIPKNIKVQGH